MAGGTPPLTKLAMAGLALAWAAMLALGGGPLDGTLGAALYAGNRPWLVDAALAITWLGDGRVLVPAVVAGAAFLLWRRRPRDALLLAALTLAGGLLVDLQKDTVARLRPDGAAHLVDTHNLSFPSGHAANSLTVWLALALLLAPPGRPRTIALASAAFVTLLVGLSRPMLGVHWPSDVIGGWSFGLIWLLLCLRLAGRADREGRSQSTSTPLPDREG